MRVFSKKVDKRSRQDMIAYLSNHFRYDTMNSWNASTSYANNMKIHSLGLDNDTYSEICALMNTNQFYRALNKLTDQWNLGNNYEFQALWNGRSGGYLVICNGEIKKSDYKSYCEECGQNNFRLATEDNCRCGKCGADARVNYDSPLMQVAVFPGRSIDQGEDFEDWDDYDLRERVKLVQSFDKLCDDILAKAVELTKKYRAVEKTVCVPQTVMVMEAVR